MNTWFDYFLKGVCVLVNLPGMEPLCRSREGYAFYFPGLSPELRVAHPLLTAPAAPTCVSLQVHKWCILRMCVNSGFSPYFRVLTLKPVLFLLSLNIFMVNRHNHSTTLSSLLASFPSKHSCNEICIICYKLFSFYSSVIW